MMNCSVTSTLPISATRPTSLRPRSSSIRCSARSLGSASSSAASSRSSAGVAPRRRVPAMGRMVTLPSRRRTRISGLEPTMAKSAEIQEEQKGRGVQPPQRAIEREGRQGEGQLEALGEHDLEDVAGQDVFLGPLDHGVELELRDIGAGLRQIGERIHHLAPLRQIAAEIGDHIGQALAGLVIGGARALVRLAARPRSRWSRDPRHCRRSP